MNAPVHYLASNDSTWTPPALISLDTETAVIQDDPEVQAMRCWHVRADYRAGVTALPAAHVTGSGYTPGDLAARVSKWASRWAETWLYAHNLSFDLTVTRLPVLLTQHGWTVADMALDGATPWMILKSGNRKLVIADSYAIWPTALAELGAALGIPKLPDPDPADLAGWEQRCAGDTAILHTALLTYMSWHDTHQLGRWAVTGAATGWNTMRHLQAARTSKASRAARVKNGLPAVDPAAQPIVIDTSPAGLEHDRKAIYGGRRETWRHGQLTPGRYSEADFTRAYQTVMATMPLPRRRGRWFDELDLDSPLIDDPCKQWGIIAEVTITTPVPRWPVRVPVTRPQIAPGEGRAPGDPPPDTRTRVFYPVGTFKTVLAGPDIAQAKRLGCLKAVHRGQVHQLGYATASWARWAIGAQDDPATPEIIRMALKHQGRAVAGKWAARAWTKQVIGLSTTFGWSYEECYIVEHSQRGAIIDLGGTKFLASPAGDSDNAYPAVLAFIESYTRVALGKVIEALGPAVTVQCDTDGLMVDIGHLISDSRPAPATASSPLSSGGSVPEILATLSRMTSPLILREKTIYRSVEITGPQHMKLDGKRRWSGVPASAQPQADGSYTAMTWPKLAWQMSSGDPRGYTRVTQDYRLATSYAPGWLLQDGTVAPPECRMRPDGQPELVPFRTSSYAPPGAVLAAQQPAALAALL